MDIQKLNEWKNAKKKTFVKLIFSRTSKIKPQKKLQIFHSLSYYAIHRRRKKLKKRTKADTEYSKANHYFFFYFSSYFHFEIAFGVFFFTVLLIVRGHSYL